MYAFLLERRWFLIGFYQLFNSVTAGTWIRLLCADEFIDVDVLISRIRYREFSSTSGIGNLMPQVLFSFFRTFSLLVFPSFSPHHIADAAWFQSDTVEAVLGVY